LLQCFIQVNTDSAWHEMIDTVTFSNGVSVPALGQGTWYMGVDQNQRKQEADALRYGLDLGMQLIDTAEMYNDAEIVVANAVQGRRDTAYIVSKVLPSNGSAKGTIEACERSLRRLRSEYIDLYLLHWSGRYPISETLESFQKLVEQGKIRDYGVSNLNIKEIEQAWATPGGTNIRTNQVLYNLHQRGIEWDLLPWCRDHSMPIMAYSPLNQGRLAPEVLEQVALRHNASRYQIALAWTLQQQDVIAIPKAATIEHIDQNLAASKIALTQEELKQIHRAFPPPMSATPLEMI
jgi:diketogulonate reductase-like aldo/keto reductase